MMNEARHATNGREDQLDEAILFYLRARAAGQPPEPRQFLDAYPPDLREELSDFLKSQNAIDAIAQAKDTPTEFGHYEVVQSINEGGFGEIYLCRDRVLNRPVAVKVLKTMHAGRPDLVLRFQEEAQIASQLEHPGIPPVHELGELPDGRPYFCMKLIQGRDLATELAHRKSPNDDLPRFLSIFLQICQAIAYAHQQDVLHRDLKSANVMVGAFGEVQVMDWGLGKVLVRDGFLEPASFPVETVRTNTSAEQSHDGDVAGPCATCRRSKHAATRPRSAHGAMFSAWERCSVRS